MSSDTILFTIFYSVVLVAIMIKLKFNNKLYVDITLGLGAFTLALISYLSYEPKVPAWLWVVSGVILIGDAYRRYRKLGNS